MEVGYHKLKMKYYNHYYVETVEFKTEVHPDITHIPTMHLMKLISIEKLDDQAALEMHVEDPY